MFFQGNADKERRQQKREKRRKIRHTKKYRKTRGKTKIRASCTYGMMSRLWGERRSLSTFLRTSFKETLQNYKNRLRAAASKNSSFWLVPRVFGAGSITREKFFPKIASLSLLRESMFIKKFTQKSWNFAISRVLQTFL